jgi:anti-sigma factor RsiW
MKERTVAGMRCSEVLALLSEYVEGELDVAAAERIEGHLLGCPNCERFGASFGSMVVALRREAETSEPVRVEAMERLLTQLRKASGER